MLVDLTQMKPGTKGIVRQLDGGWNFINKIQNMGIREGKRISKISSHFWRGPQTIELDNLRIAIGFGMAKRIFVEVEE